MARRSGRWANVWAVLAGREGPQGVWPAIVQLVLVLLWHPAIFNVCIVVQWLVEHRAAEYARRIGASQSRDLPEFALLAPSELRDVLISAGLIAFEGFLAYLIFILASAKSPRTRVSFFRFWWRSCLWNSLFAAACAAVEGVFPSVAEPIALIIGLSFCLSLAVLPTLLARAESRPRRLIRWRPECPECGYSVRRAAGGRCPECGEAYPTPSRAYRRWAVRKLLWERQSRGSLIVAYVKTTLGILFFPWCAGWRNSDPTRMARAMRWGVVHGLLAVILTSLLSPSISLTYWLLSDFARAARVSAASDFFDIPPDAVLAVWTAQSMLVHVIAVATLPGLAATIGWIVADRRPAAVRTTVKWSCYALASLNVAVVAWCILRAVLAWQRGTPTLAETLNFALRAPPEELLAVVYAVVWAAGTSANSWAAQRGLGRSVTLCAAFLVVWALLAAVLFPLGPMSDLL